jgi:glycosyltransferase involved in cell wall biosynthesis
MKVFMSGTSFRPEYGGPAVSVPRLARALAEHGASVVLWAPDGSAPLLADKANHPSIELWGGSLSNAMAGRRGFDVIHDNGIWLAHNHALARAAKANGVARVVSVRGMLEPWSLAHRQMKKRAAWHLYQKCDLNRADCIHCTAEAEAQNVARLGLNPNCVVIPNGVDMPPETALRPSKAAVDTMSEQGTRRMVFVSRLHRQKGIPVLLEAWASLSPKGWELLIAGPPEHKHDREILEQVDRLGLGQDVHYLGPMYGEDKQELMLSADVFVLPTHTENFGMVIAEALALERPVLTTTGAPWELLISEQCGWWVEPTQSGIRDGLVAAMSATDETRRAMGVRGRSVVKHRFAWERIGADMAAVYETVLARRRHARSRP